MLRRHLSIAIHGRAVGFRLAVVNVLKRVAGTNRSWSQVSLKEAEVVSSGVSVLLSEIKTKERVVAKRVNKVLERVQGEKVTLKFPSIFITILITFMILILDNVMTAMPSTRSV